MTAHFDDEAEGLKTYKVRNNDGKYLSFDFDWRSGKMNPLWASISMSYPFSQEEATRLARVHKAHVIPKLVWEAEMPRMYV